MFRKAFHLFPSWRNDIEKNLILKKELFYNIYVPFLVAQRIQLTSSQGKLFDDYYWPVYCFIKLQHAIKKGKPLFVGLSAPQGCGKTTLTDLMKLFCAHENLAAATMSLDDFYLTGEEQDNLARNKSNNRLLAFRGNAGTHDVPLLLQTLQSLRASPAKEPIVKIPRYSKSLRQGRGDRLPIDQWKLISNPVDIVILEGWMLGFSPIYPTLSVDKISPFISSTDYSNIQEINEYLKAYDCIHAMMNTWIILAIDEIEIVYQWRLEAEQKMKAAGKEGMSDEAVKEFVSRFMPAYAQYRPSLYHHGPTSLVTQNPQMHSCPSISQPSTCPILKISMNMQRQPIEYELLNPCFPPQRSLL